MSNQDELLKNFQEISEGGESITKSQLKNYLTKVNDNQGKQVITNQEIDEVFIQMDENHDGKITFEEFCLFSAFSKHVTKKFLKNIKPLMKVVSEQKDLNVSA